MIHSGPSIPIPRNVPLLPLQGKVLLPGIVTRLQITRRDSVPLFERILRTYDSKELGKCVIGVFPIYSPASSSSTLKDSDSNSNNGDKGKSVKPKKNDNNNDQRGEDPIAVGSSVGQIVPMRPGSNHASSPALSPSSFHTTGCAARVVRLERTVGGFTVIIEGKFVLFVPFLVL